MSSTLWFAVIWGPILLYRSICVPTGKCYYQPPEISIPCIRTPSSKRLLKWPFLSPSRIIVTASSLAAIKCILPASSSCWMSLFEQNYWTHCCSIDVSCIWNPRLPLCMSGPNKFGGLSARIRSSSLYLSCRTCMFSKQNNCFVVLKFWIPS